MDFGQLGALLPYVAPIITLVVGWLIRKFQADKVIGDLAEVIDDNATRVVAVQDAITEAFKPDAEGKVELTTDEVKEIYVSMDILLEGFGIDLPDWPS